MIIDGIINVFILLLDSLYGILPEWEFLNPFTATDTTIPTLGNTVISDGGNPLKVVTEWAAQYNQVIPVQEAYGLFVLYLVLQSVVFVFQTIRFVINVVRGAGA